MSGLIEVRILREELTMLKSFTYFGAKGVLAAVAMTVMPASHAAVTSMQSEIVSDKAQCSARVGLESAECKSEVSQPLLAIKKICTISPEGNICLPKKAPKRSKTSPEKNPKPQMA